MQRRRFKNSTKQLLAHSTRACQYMKYIYCVSYEALTCPRRNTYPKVTQTALFSVFQIKFYLSLFSLTFAYPYFHIIFESVIFTL